MSKPAPSEKLQALRQRVNRQKGGRIRLQEGEPASTPTANAAEEAAPQLPATTAASNAVANNSGAGDGFDLVGADDADRDGGIGGLSLKHKNGEFLIGRNEGKLPLGTRCLV